MDNAETKRSFMAQIRRLPANFWFANIMETFERLAFFGVRAIAPLYLVASSGQNGLGLDYGQKGIIYSVWALLQCLVPMVSGGYTERYGYRKSLAVAFLINILGYLGMAQSKSIADALALRGWENPGFWVFLVAACLIGIGTAIFKPPVHGTIAKTTDEETSSLGWGIFYWVVNIGGALAPMVAALLRVEIDWDNVFYFAAGVTAFNFLPAFLLYKEPEKTAQEEGSLGSKGPFGVFFSSISTIFLDLRLVVFLAIFSCFWLMFMQLWDLLPNFIDEWVDTSDVAAFFGWFSQGWILESGQTKPEMIINIDAISIIILVIPISWLIGRINKVAAMVIGMLIALVGFVGAGVTTIGLLCCLMVFVFSIGEMACSPTFSAYVGLIAPKDKKALYMGYSNIPFAVGWALGGLIGGFIYDAHGAKASLALKYLAAKTELVAQAARATDWSDSLDKIHALLAIDRNDAFDVARGHLGMEPGPAAETLREDFRFDRGQITNLALEYLALHPHNRQKTLDGFRKMLTKADDEPDTSPPTAEGRPATAEPSAEESHDDQQATQRVKELTARLEALTKGELKANEVSLAAFVHYLPTVINTKRNTAFEAVRELVNADSASESAKTDTEIIALLWKNAGDNRDVLNNLALEYLAQGTNVVHDAVAGMTYKHAAEEVDERVKEIEARIGIDRSKSFNSLSAAVGDETKVDEALRGLTVASDRPNDRLYVYLISQPRQRLAALSQKDWKKDVGILRDILRVDENAMHTVIQGIDKESWSTRIVNAVREVFASEEVAAPPLEGKVDYKKLVRKKELIQKALAVVDWRKLPNDARRLMGVNPFEARALIMANTDQAEEILWNRYHPYMVWYYLGAVGLAGTIGMIIFYFVTRGAMAMPNENKSETTS